MGEVRGSDCCDSVFTRAEPAQPIIAMAKRDKITGKWTASIERRSGLDLVETCIDLKGYDVFCDTQRSNDLLGSYENVRFNKKGHMKGDLYDGANYLGKVKIHKRWLDFDGNYLDGMLSINTRLDSMKMFDDDFGSGWVAKIFYADDVF